MLDLSQAGAAAAAGLSITTYKRLEAGENVNLDVLIRALIALDAVDDLRQLFPPIETRSISDLISKKRQRKRGRRSAL